MKKQLPASGLWKKYFSPAVMATGLTLITAITAHSQTYAPFTILPISQLNYGGQVRPAFADLDNDGDLDLMTTNNQGGFGALWLYFENTGTRYEATFGEPQFNPLGLSNNMGGWMTPTFADIDNDGDMDLFVGAYHGTYFLQNIGTVSSPSFAAPIQSAFGMSLSGYYEAPTFADMDNDGDLDMLSGVNTGNMYYLQNTGTISAPAFAGGILFPFGISNQGTIPRPMFIDMDLDGDQDLLVGRNDGDYAYMQNTGTVTAPAFAAAVTNPFGLTSTGNTYNSCTAADLDFDGDLDIFEGDNTHMVKHFENITPVPQPGVPTSTTAAEDLLICNGSTAELTASGIATGFLGWYDSATDGNWLGAGPSFTTEALTATTTFYVQDSTAGGASASRAAVTVNVTAAFEAPSITPQETAFCESGDLVVILGGSETGASYYLRASSDDAIVDGPITGTGSEFAFNPHTVSTASSYNVFVTKEVPNGAGTLTCEYEFPQSVTVVINQPVAHTETVDVCYGSDFTYADGTIAEAVTENESHISTLASAAANGCDSVVTQNLISLQQVTGVLTSTICFEEEITVNGTIYDATHFSGTEVLENAAMNGCDSVVTISLNVLPELTGTVTETLCAGEQLVINGTVYDLLHPTGTEVFGNVGEYGCDSTVTINLSYNPAINPTVNVSGLTMTAAQFSATYQWINCANGMPIAGATGASFTATANGTYAVVINWNDCVDTSGCTAISTVGMDEFQTSPIVLYPNPAETTFKLGGTDQLPGIREISILDGNGKTIITGTQAETTFDVSTFAPGVYHVRILHEKGIETIRLIRK